MFADVRASRGRRVCNSLLTSGKSYTRKRFRLARLRSVKVTALPRTENIHRYDGSIVQHFQKKLSPRTNLEHGPDLPLALSLPSRRRVRTRLWRPRRFAVLWQHREESQWATSLESDTIISCPHAKTRHETSFPFCLWAPFGFCSARNWHAKWSLLIWV